MNLPTIIICALLLLICVYSAISYKKKLTSGCCGAEAEPKVKPKDRNLSHYKYAYKIGIDGMTCSHCKERVENTFNSQDGTASKVKLKGKCAYVYTKQPLDIKKARETVTKSGYTLRDFTVLEPNSTDVL